MTTLEKVVKVLTDHTDKSAEEISDKSTFEELGLDSLDTVELVMALEETFDITLEVEEQILDVKQLVDLIDSKL